MQSVAYSVAPAATGRVFRLRNLLLFAGVLLMHWTLLRPSPADAIFMLVLPLSLICNPRINARALVFFVLVFLWAVSVFFSSIAVLSAVAMTTPPGRVVRK